MPAFITPDEVFSTTIDDGKYRLLVARLDSTSNYDAYLHVYEGETLIHYQPVLLAYGALFGPDIDDVTFWSEIALDVIDNPEKRKMLNEGITEL